MFVNRTNASVITVTPFFLFQQKIILLVALSSNYWFDKIDKRVFINFFDIWKVFEFVCGCSEISSHYPISVSSECVEKMLNGS